MKEFITWQRGYVLTLLEKPSIEKICRAEVDKFQAGTRKTAWKKLLIENFGDPLRAYHFEDMLSLK